MWLQRVRRWTYRRFSPDGRLGLRLTLACAAVLLVAVPFVVLLALVNAHWAPLRHLDDTATLHTHGFVLRHRALVGPLRATAYVFHPWVFRIVLLALAAWLLYRGARRLAAWATTNVLVAGVVSGTLKAAVGRTRPVLPSPIAHAGGGSFPSGHALMTVVGTATLVLVFLPLLRRAWRAVAWVAAAVLSVASGLFRVLLGVHYLSDVLGGWILGVAIVLATTAAFETWRRGEGRRPADPIREGAEPEAEPRITGDDHATPA
ncbi:phosphatase PAP2 family protein [Actinoallomurus soli]|uniref:phosphatase PAP2 family protein n=1 Tax=Actinoallomurus soli TaxID=2952535 RepID=UPI0020939A60|nr:phosphatase PAP2 family protein [Actinoallomurus soli]MCO5973823.1 phosphatase PAP2 family protein [Actinoallomurus soli]